MTYNPKLYVFSEYYITEENIGGFIMEYSDFGLIQGIVGHRLVENQIHLKKNFALNFQVQYYVSLYHQEQP